MKQYVYKTSTARLTLQPVFSYFVKVDDRVVFFSHDFKAALDYFLAWCENHEDKTRISMDMDGRAEWRQVSSTDGAESATFC